MQRSAHRDHHRLHPHQIDPAKRAAFEAYAQRWPAIIPPMRRRFPGY
jgi:hypothetical protein